MMNAEILKVIFPKKSCLLKKVSYTCLLSISIMTACDSDKNGREPELPQITEYTLDLGRDSITLEYLQRDTIRIYNTDNNPVNSINIKQSDADVNYNNVKWYIQDGDSCISMIGNVVIGRRKGMATLIASYNNQFGKITVNVKSEEYIPVEKVIFEINGSMYTTGDTLYFPTCETVNLKWIKTEPHNATWSRVGRSLLWSTLSDGEGSIANDEERMLKQQGIDTATTRLKGFIHELDGFKFLVHPTIEHGLWIDQNPDSNEKKFVPKDSIPSWVFDVFFEIWPKDLQRSGWDIIQLEKHFPKELLKEYNPLFCKRICFADLDNTIEIESEGKHLNDGSSRLFIHAGETKQLKTALFAPYSWRNYVTWEDANINDKYDYKLLLEENGTLHLPADFSEKDLQGFGYSDKELSQDTVYIGRINAYLMKEPYRSQWLEQYSYIKWNTPKVETIKSKTASVYWIK